MRKCAKFKIRYVVLKKPGTIIVCLYKYEQNTFFGGLFMHRLISDSPTKQRRTSYGSL